MDFVEEAVLPVPPARVWPVLVDVARVAACVPGCEQVEEVAAPTRYRAVMKQRVGPFRLEVPLEITVEETREPERIRAVASGRDRITGATVSATLGVALAPDGTEGTRLGVTTTLTVGGRIAALGYSVIRRRAEEAFAEFSRRLRAVIEAG
jgi:carbon monoxide dehydrogenase subunit G